jgi:phage protein D
MSRSDRRTVAVATVTKSTVTPGLPTDYYAPDYRVLVNGQALHPDTKGDVLEVKVVMDIDNLTSFEMTVNNWDDEKLAFKYSDSHTFDVGVGIEVLMGYANRLVSMVKGQITGLTPQFPASGTPTLSITGLDAMFLLKDRKPLPGDRKIFVNMADWEIAQVIATRNQLQLNASQVGEKHDQVVQKNQDDAQFLMERAKRIDFDCYIANDPVTQQATLNFAVPTDSREAQKATYYQFTWGTNLISFSPQLTLSKQVSQVTVRGWDPKTKQTIVATATPSDLPGGGDGASGPAAAGANFPNKQDVVVDSPVTSAEEARTLAISLLRERAYEFITGSGQVIGVPDLRPGDNVRLEGLGTRFTADYYVKKVEHTLGSSGYLTSFEVRSTYAGGPS